MKNYYVQGLDPTKKKSYRNYKVLVIFSGTRWSLKLSKEKMRRFNQINKEIKKLSAESENLFKKSKKK